MNLEKLVSISGLPGIYKVVANKHNGIIVESIENGSKRFIASRSHQYSLLDSLSVYTDDGDTVPLSKVFQNMLDQFEDNPPADTNGPTEAVTEYFEDVLPNYDKYKVHLSHMKKIIKWFVFLQTHNAFEAKEAPSETPDETTS
jgi:hypothetical protein